MRGYVKNTKYMRMMTYTETWRLRREATALHSLSAVERSEGDLYRHKQHYV